MSTPLIHPPLARHGHPVSRRAALPLWNPYLAGALLGIVLLATYAIAGRGLGASAAFSALAAWLAGSVSVAAVEANPVHARYWHDGAPLLNWTLFLLLGAALGARIAKGCTSGQALTGGALLNVGSLVFMLAVFASAYALAYFVRKEWL